MLPQRRLITLRLVVRGRYFCLETLKIWWYHRDRPRESANYLRIVWCPSRFETSLVRFKLNCIRINHNSPWGDAKAFFCNPHRRLPFASSRYSRSMSTKWWHHQGSQCIHLCAVWDKSPGWLLRPACGSLHKIEVFHPSWVRTRWVPHPLFGQV